MRKRRHSRVGHLVELGGKDGYLGVSMRNKKEIKPSRGALIARSTKI